MLAGRRATSDPSFAYGWPYEPSFVNCRSATQNLPAIHGRFSMLTRRQFGSSAFAVAGSLILPNLSGAAQSGTAPLINAIEQLELKSGGRLGVSVLDTATGVPIHHKGDERFPMCSTFKLLASAAILKDAGNKLERLERRVR